jgi:hypothetical protein
MTASDPPGKGRLLTAESQQLVLMDFFDREWLE